MRGTVLLISACAVLPLALSGCGDVKHAFGLEKTIPNEFDVVSNAPLAIPPDFNLRPPRPGAAPTQGQNPTLQAKETIFRAGGDKASFETQNNQFSAGEEDILRAAGAQRADGDIRSVVNQEASESQPFNRTFVDRLLFYRQNKEAKKALLDPVKETARLEDQNANKTVSTQFSAPPTVQRKSDSSFLDRIF
ncbi:MAG TPA: DUF3035 domain-containing protein [Stellaceae bacterium]|nr:DUF3035 domain-containing protein [Stellaceae bacterium]